MGESNLHKYLKLLGIKYLDAQGCRLVATEIYVRKSASDFWLNGDIELKKRAEHYNQYLDGMEAHLKKNHDSDSKWIIDVLGIGEKNVMARDISWNNTAYQPMKKVGTETLLRGIEVKVSRNDFRNGYCQTGLNYHYILCPELLVKKSEIPKHIGLLYWRGGQASSVYCAKRPRRMELNKEMVDVYRESIYRRYHSQIMSMTRDQLSLLSRVINSNDLSRDGNTDT